MVQWLWLGCSGPQEKQSSWHNSGLLNISFGDDWSGPLAGGEMQGKTEVLKTVFTVFLINSSWGCPRFGARLEVSSPVSWPLKERGLI